MELEREAGVGAGGAPGALGPKSVLVTPPPHPPPPPTAPSAPLWHLLRGGAGPWDVPGSSSPFSRQKQESDLPRLPLTPFTTRGQLAKWMQTRHPFFWT